MALVRQLKENDLMYFTRYAIDFFHAIYKDLPSEHSLDERLRHRKYWAADQFMNDSPDQKVFVVEVEGKVVGYIMGIIEADENEGRTGTLQELFVDEFYRREGLGTELCKHMFEWFWSHNISTIQLSLEAGHPKVHAFMESVGFITVRTKYEYKKE
ncbi:GNAT family N-acetyltransferase [Halobacillus yeomjeoni]|uniref:GNAT family N-acetyltransferase n=1 Tax=Halobacillus yeomjeoni TaxID=311194 RepID=UPI001CD6C9C5|nr:GNAT family N-acetyltransferase [Halobacillus yeomjeoni]MCA0985071.1 GNAT family N-acetyltransferase [Halobacillus yeomjeoni]